MDVPASCTVTDIDGVTHNYPEINSPNSYLAICALDAAIKNNFISSVKLSNQFPSMGLFITTINDVTADPNSQYWAIYQNGSLANSGIVLLPVITGDTISFKLNDFSDTNLGDQVILHINSLSASTPPPTPEPETVSVSHSGGGGQILNIQTAPIVKPTFDTKKAFEFLISQQKENGSFGEDLYTDWTSLAFASTTDYQIQKDKLIKYYTELKTKDYQLTDYERRAMATMSLGLNPYNINGENYIEKITGVFDGKQFGDPNEDNDDIFALTVLQNTGFTKDEKIIGNTIDFILSKQKENGSWDNSVDMTGAGIEALVSFNENLNVKNSLERAKEFLKQNQKDDGGFGNVSATAWAMEGILSLGEKPEDWVKNKNSPLDYLAENQDTDGGIKNENKENKIWETAYVLSALSGKSWNQIMQKFSKPIVETPTFKKVEIPTSQTKTLKNVEKIDPKNITASPINAITNNQEPKQIIKQNWFRRLLNKIFGF